MKSGDDSVSRTGEEMARAFAAIRDCHFEQCVFSARPALVARQLINGYRQSKDYHGEPFDASLYDLVSGMWGHDHCTVCFFRIEEGFTYWENHRRIILLCDACYEAFTKS